MSIYHKIPENSSLDVNGTHVLGAFYWKIIGHMVAPFSVWKTTAVETCVPFMRLDKSSLVLSSELRGGRNETCLKWNTFFTLLTFPF